MGRNRLMGSIPIFSSMPLLEDETLGYEPEREVSITSRGTINGYQTTIGWLYQTVNLLCTKVAVRGSIPWMPTIKVHEALCLTSVSPIFICFR